MSPLECEKTFLRAAQRLTLLWDGFDDAQKVLLREGLMRLAREQRRPVVFVHVGMNEAGQDVFEIGREGEPTRLVSTRCGGVWAVWWCLHYRTGSRLRTADLSAPHAGSADASVRRQIRTTAAAEIREWAQPELEALALACSVAGGTVNLELRANAPTFITSK